MMNTVLTNIEYLYKYTKSQWCHITYTQTCARKFTKTAELWINFHQIMILCIQTDKKSADEHQQNIVTKITRHSFFILCLYWYDFILGFSSCSIMKQPLQTTPT